MEDGGYFVSHASFNKNVLHQSTTPTLSSSREWQACKNASKGLFPFKHIQLLWIMSVRIISRVYIIFYTKIKTNTSKHREHSIGLFKNRVMNLCSKTILLLLKSIHLSLYLVYHSLQMEAKKEHAWLSVSSLWCIKYCVYCCFRNTSFLWFLVVVLFGNSQDGRKTVILFKLRRQNVNRFLKYQFCWGFSFSVFK